MTDRRLEAPGDHAHAVPRDLPDQQAQDGPDPLDVDSSAARYSPPDDPDDDVPDLDESGTGRRGSPRQSGSPRPDHPIPDEPSG
ncbi:hypothetical protein [Streptomyces sp. ME19-01-6]|uniref:hypothetical protein n=1 Tax=Streptomyces sp. ME19-01-6 TaxID=3028686 RepID=UPI0029AEE325|nr:hypothetical protein [Streptomyces sp. ME19-01-6]MDX3224659.1 hypothetical protein [Streptomyces sp. ME19-01-6]